MNNEITHVCVACKTELPKTTEFYRFRKNRGNFSTKCIKCERAYAKEYHKKNKEKKNKASRERYHGNLEYERNRSRKYHEENKEEIMKKGREYYHNNKEKRAQYNKKRREENKEHVRNISRKSYYKNIENIKKYREENKEKISEANKKWRENNVETNKAHQKEWRKNNAEKQREYQREYYKIRKLVDPTFSLSIKVRSTIKNAFKHKGYKKNGKSAEILGCSFGFFREYIEEQFEEWMSWDNRGLYNGEENFGWDVDHIIPISHAESEEDVVRLSHYLNLRPLCSYKNRVGRRGEAKRKKKNNED